MYICIYVNIYICKYKYIYIYIYIYIKYQPGKVMKEINEGSINIDLYYCKNAISRFNKIGPIAAGHLPRKISGNHFHFLQEGGSTKGSIADIHGRVSPIPKGGLDILTLMYFVHRKKQ